MPNEVKIKPLLHLKFWPVACVMALFQVVAEYSILPQNTTDVSVFRRFDGFNLSTADFRIIQNDWGSKVSI